MNQYKRHGTYSAWSIGSILFWTLMTAAFVVAVFALTGIFR